MLTVHTLCNPIQYIGQTFVVAGRGIFYKVATLKMLVRIIICDRVVRKRQRTGMGFSPDQHVRTLFSMRASLPELGL